MEEELLPPRMFAAGDEPVGERINSYHKVKTTRSILAALEPDELEDERIKFACLAITSSILFPSSHAPRIIPEHVELIRDLNEFLAFPWGRAAYQTLATTLISKDALSLSKASLAIRGYVDAIQLVLIAAIPQLKEEITESSKPIVIPDSDSEGESPDEATASEDDNAMDQEKTGPITKYVIIPGHAKTADMECQLGLCTCGVPCLSNLYVPVNYQHWSITARLYVILVLGIFLTLLSPILTPTFLYFASMQVLVKNILDDPYEGWSNGLDFSWVDELEDPAVDNMAPVGEEAECEDTRPSPSDFVDDISLLEDRIYQALDAKLEKLFSPNSQSRLGAFIQSTITQCLKDTDQKIGDATARCMKDMQAAIIQAVTCFIGDPRTLHVSPVENISKETTIGLVHVSGSTHCPVSATISPLPQHITPAEAAERQIDDVLRDLNLVPEVPLSACPDADVSQHLAVDTEEHLEEPDNQKLCDDPPVEEEGNDGDGKEPDIKSPTGQSLGGELPEEGDGSESDQSKQAGQPLLAEETHEILVEEPERSGGGDKLEKDENLLTVNVECKKPCPALVAEHITQERKEHEALNEALNEEIHIPYCYLLEMPSFSLGLSQEDGPVVEETQQPEEVVEQRKSKRPKLVPVGLQDYKCDPKVTGGLSIIPDLDQRFDQIEQTLSEVPGLSFHNGYSLTSAEFCDIAYRKNVLPTGVVDALIGVVASGPAFSPKVSIHDTSFPASLMKHHFRFVKTAVKDRHKLKFTDVPLLNPLVKSPERLYFPFNMDRQHWVGVCIDIKSYTIHVLDCNTSLRTDSMLKKELTPIANLIPYVLKQYGYLESNAPVKAFTVSRCKGIPQVSSPTDAAVMTVLFIEAHASDGLGGCKAITPRLLPEAAKQLTVKLFDEIWV
ncbi:Uncharacterized protein Rs2_26941 [Raphanus sativus]|nr:Uncharacterized protein Rs2_26941 [Raphanus sativus]